MSLLLHHPPSITRYASTSLSYAKEATWVHSITRLSAQRVTECCLTLSLEGAFSQLTRPLKRGEYTQLRTHRRLIMPIRTYHFHRLVLRLCHWKLIGMPLMPGVPGRPYKVLDDPSRRAGKERAQQAE